MIFFKTIISFLRDKDYRNLLLTTIILLIVGAFTYQWLEGWEFIDALYFCVITLTTIGYGDFSPQTTEGKLFTIFYILIGIGMILSFINTVYQHYNEVKKSHKEDRKQD